MGSAWGGARGSAQAGNLVWLWTPTGEGAATGFRDGAESVSSPSLSLLPAQGRQAACKQGPHHVRGRAQRHCFEAVLVVCQAAFPQLGQHGEAAVRTSLEEEEGGRVCVLPRAWDAHAGCRRSELRTAYRRAQNPLGTLRM